MTAPKDEVPWWLPVLCDEAYFARLRTDYPRNAYMTNAALHEHYNEGRKYSIVWDHIGDAYAEYEPLADAFLTMAALLERIVEAAECHPIDTDAIGEARDLLSRLGRGK